jgi:hypothetical protein
MPTEQRDDVGQLALLVDRDDCESTSAASFPIDRDVFGVSLCDDFVNAQDR